MLTLPPLSGRGRRFVEGRAAHNALHLSGRRFGRLTVVAREGSASGKRGLWSCRCDCGNTKTVCATDLNRGVALHCGCLRPKAEDLTGRRFGAWTVLGFHSRLGRKYLWSCRCECGVERRVNAADLRAGRSASCGCKKVAYMLATLADDPREYPHRDPADLSWRSPKVLPLEGRVFGRWRVVAFAGRNRYSRSLWDCVCEVCGYRKTVLGAHLRGGCQPRCRCPQKKPRKPLIPLDLSPKTC